MSIDPAPYWTKLLLYFFVSKYVHQLISKRYPRAYKFYGTSRFINDLCKENDDSKFSSSCKYIYPKQSELNLEHQEEHATFLDLDLTIENNISTHKLFDKREKFPFFIVHMGYLSSSTPSSIFYGSIFSEFLRIARCAQGLTNFVPKASQLYTRIITQDGNKVSTLRQIKNAFQRHIFSIFQVL